MDEPIIEIVKANLKEIRSKQGLSLDKLATKCGVSRAMLSQIEQGKSTPTITLLWKIANGLDIQFSDLFKEKTIEDVYLIKEKDSKVLFSKSKFLTSRALFPSVELKNTEFYELTLKPMGIEESEPHKLGTTENIVVTSGNLILKVMNQEYFLSPKDSIFFKADSHHTYINPSNETTVMYMVIEYKD